MSKSIFYRMDASVLCIVLFFILLLAVALGNRMRRRFWNPEEGETKGGVNSLLGALFGLWGFMLAFTFNQAGNRFENVRVMMVDEANYLRTAIIRADLFPDNVRAAYRADLRKYLEERISYYDDVTDEVKFKKNREELSKTADTLWARTVEQSKMPNMFGAVGNMNTALTNLFDIGIKREALLNASVPTPVVYMLVILGLSICLVGGFTTPIIKRKEWIVVIVFAFLAVLVLYITVDMGRPMRGLIKPDAGEQTIVNLRRFFK